MNLLVSGQKGRKISSVIGIKPGAVLFSYCLLCTMSNSSTKFIDFLAEVNSPRSPIFWLEISISPMKKHGFNQARRLGCEDRVWETVVTLVAGITFILQVECKILPHFTFYPIHITFWGAPKMVLRKQRFIQRRDPAFITGTQGSFPEAPKAQLWCSDPGAPCCSVEELNSQSLPWNWTHTVLQACWQAHPTHDPWATLGPIGPQIHSPPFPIWLGHIGWLMQAVSRVLWSRASSELISVWSSLRLDKR